MDLPLWFLWLLAAAVAYAITRRPQEPVPSATAAVLLLVAVAWMTVSHFWVGEDELLDATEWAVQVVDEPSSGGSSRLDAVIEREVGRPVTSTPEGEGGDGPRDFCLEIAVDGPLAGGGARSHVTVDYDDDRSTSLRYTVDAESGPCP